MSASSTTSSYSKTAPLFSRLCVIGCGLIGSSIARAAKAEAIVGQITVYDSDPNVRKKARALELGRVCDTIEIAVQKADLVIICTPIGRFSQIAASIAPHLMAGSILSDVGSVKAATSEAITPHLPETVHFVPGHPIAGTEHSGPEAGFAELFIGAKHILCPASNTPDDVISALTAFWQALGASVSTMNAIQHDRILAITSHLPHLIAFNIVGTARDMETVDDGEVVKYSAGGFRDFTRIASSDPVMWRDVFLNNKVAILEVLGRFTEDLIAMQRAIRWDDGAYLEEKIHRARAIRADILDNGPGDFTQSDPEKNIE